MHRVYNTHPLRAKPVQDLEVADGFAAGSKVNLI